MHKRAFQIAMGLGAGNIGDELMSRAMWQSLPPDVLLDIPLFPESRRQHEPYPAPHRYLAVNWPGNENEETSLPGLLACDTPVSETEGLHWPLGFLAPRLQHFHRAGLAVDAVGVGVDRLQSPQALALFQEHFSPIRSWTVRSSNCRDALLAMGIPRARICVGADWAWLYRRSRPLRQWAEGVLSANGLDPKRPLLLANVVNMVWRDAAAAKRNLARALDRASRQLHLQIAFFCNECRPGEYFDFEAAREISSLMMAPSRVLPNEYYSPDEALALVACASIAVGQRYHFVVEAALADVPPIGILREQKMRTLATELGFPVGGSVDLVDEEVLYTTIADTIEHRAEVVAHIQENRARLTLRAKLNLSFLCSEQAVPGIS
jgi:polysaccharide pyruvyl transferase WcaK-like protein